ncbi:hypothetical protein [Ovoidimarina sediminis]|uniref:hypothetical protein n=1 Tax=Ovoidimarina sediminis TaxID=3079856 RepID=UPI0029126CC2|nr:hypothetical protein [Rhodophyticola sp. MJ-SS7]MDU8944910.1 hypothetical protein [Rhodophyticola sp. MJ-SS7]
MSNIYDYIDDMRQRPSMFTTDLSIGPLEWLLQGYCACLQSNEIEETYAGRRFHPGDFSEWLYGEIGWSGARGFAFAIEENTATPAEAFDTFFRLVQQFRQGKVPK